jgi:N-acetylglucosamine kinase
MKKVIGIDAGGSKTLALLVDETGTVCGRVRAGGANPRSLGKARAATSLREALAPLLSSGEVSAICIGAAGAGREDDRAFFESEVRAIAGPTVTLLLRNDAQIVLRAGAAARPAMAVIAGTGSLVYGESASGASARCGGYGALLGDDGSAYSLGLAALKHTARVLDQLAPAGKMSGDIIAALDASSVSELIERVQHWPPDIGAIAALASMVGEAAEAGDPAAQTLVAAASDSLGPQVARVARLVRTPQSLPVIVSGGAFEAVPRLLEAVRQGAAATGPSELRRLSLEPAHGAALLALEAAGIIRSPG